MAARDRSSSKSQASAQEELEAGARARLERDSRLPMRDRLARVHELCKQMTTVSGAARRR